MKITDIEVTVMINNATVIHGILNSFGDGSETNLEEVYQALMDKYEEVLEAMIKINPEGRVGIEMCVNSKCSSRTFSLKKNKIDGKVVEWKELLKYRMNQLMEKITAKFK